MNQNITDIIQDFILFFESSSSENIVITGNYSTNPEDFICLLQENEFFSKQKTLTLISEDKKSFKKILSLSKAEKFDIIFVLGNIFPLYEIENFKEEYSLSGRIIFVTNNINEWDQDNTFRIPEIPFRQYAKGENNEINIAEILKWVFNRNKYENIFHSYLQSGSFIKNIHDPTEISQDFQRKCKLMSAELFEKEREIFIDFIRILALEVWNLFKEDKLAKQLWISRRKIWKFIETLKKHGIIIELFPFVENSDIELSRHKKIYFSDLSYLQWALDVMYNIGAQKSSAIENFIFLELSRKLGDSHELFFWRKKSWAGIHFILQDQKNNQLTPIEINTKNTKNISVIMKNFYELYSDRIANSMILNEKEIFNGNFSWKPFFILPYYAI